MSQQISNNLTYLKLLEASQSAFESSEMALKAAEEAFNAAKRVNIEAKAAQDAATITFWSKNVVFRVFTNIKKKLEKVVSLLSKANCINPKVCISYEQKL